jgi:hypothetical protein
MILCPDMARTKEFRAGGSFFDIWGCLEKTSCTRPGQRRGDRADAHSCALRAPMNYFVGDRPTTRGQQIVTAGKIDGISLAVAQPATGTLYLQCVVRVFGTPPTEATIEHTVTMSGTHGATRVPLQWKFDPKDVQFARTAELWLGWQGDRELELAEEPNLF